MEIPIVYWGYSGDSGRENGYSYNILGLFRG